APTDLHGHHGRHESQRTGVVAVEYHQPILTKYRRFGMCVCVQRSMPVEMVFGDVEHRGGRGQRIPWATRCTVELKAGELQHPDGRQVWWLGWSHCWWHQHQRSRI